MGYIPLQATTRRGRPFRQLAVRMLSRLDRTIPVSLTAPLLNLFPLSAVLSLSLASSGLRALPPIELTEKGSVLDIGILALS